jgi:uncharacterized protein (TIGR01777 family)
MEIALSGAGGFIGRQVTEILEHAGHPVQPLRIRELKQLPRADAVVHLAGEPVAQRWTEEAKTRIRQSRVEGTLRLVKAMENAWPRPLTFVCASAVGFYGDRGEETLTEASRPGAGFLAEVCEEWEKAAASAEPLGIRVVRLRIGVVLGRGGGALRRMLPPFRLGMGGRIGSGRQWMSWIHIDDVAGLVRFAIEQPLVAGAVNATAPQPVTNADFTRTLAGVLRRPAIFPVPPAALRLMFGEMASVMLESQRVLPEAAAAAGYAFRYGTLRPALRDAVA